MVEVETKVALQPTRGRHVAGVALEASTDVLDRFTLSGELGWHPGKLRAEAAAHVNIGRLLLRFLTLFRWFLEAAHPAEKALAADRLHLVPVLGGDLQMELPDLRDPE